MLDIIYLSTFNKNGKANKNKLILKILEKGAVLIHKLPTLSNSQQPLYFIGFRKSFLKYPHNKKVLP
jgi:hypothetical protein